MNKGLWILVLIALLFFSAAIHANDDMAAASGNEIERLLEEVQSQLRALTQSSTEETLAFNVKVSALKEEIDGLKSQELEAIKELDEATKKFATLTEKSFEMKQKKSSGETQQQAFLGEIRRQAVDLRDRFESSLMMQEHKDLWNQITELVLLTNDEFETADALVELGEIYQAIRKHSSAFSSFKTELKLDRSAGKISEVNVLRLGLLGGYYHHDESGESGILQSAKGQMLAGHSAGLSDEQLADIHALVMNPKEGGLAPIDISGGSGLASLQATDSANVWFEKGGVFMIPMSIIAALALLVVLERAVVLTVKRIRMDKPIQAIVDSVESSEFEKAEELCHKAGGAAGNVLFAAINHRDRDRAVLEDAVQESLLHNGPQFHTRLSFIALCAAVSPLLGLLGTVTGMITTFKYVTLFGTSDPRYMAGGISEALITTQAGLYLAIPCLLCRGFLGSIADGAVSKLEAGAMSIVLSILESKDGPDSDANSQGATPLDSDELEIEDGFLSAEDESLDPSNRLAKSKANGDPLAAGQVEEGSDVSI